MMSPGSIQSAQEDSSPGWLESGPTGRARSRRAGYVAAIIVNAIMIYVVHHALDWGVPFLTPAFASVVWAFDLSFMATILANFIYLGYDARWFRQLLQIGLNGIAILVTAVLYGIFPFDFGLTTTNDLAHLCLIFVLVALVIATIVQAIVFITDLIRVPDPAQRL